MIPYPFSTFDMSEENAQLQFDIYTKLKNTYQLEIDTDLPINIRDFHIFNSNELNSYGAVFRILKNTRSFYINFLEILYRTGVSRYSSNIHLEYQTWGSINLKNNFGHILIKPETFLDKIHNMINPVDLDFEDDKEFSKKFLVVTNDKQKAQMQMTQNFRNCISKIEVNEFMIEIFENKLIIGDKKVVSPESVLCFAKFLNEMAIAF
jgi:hypothetical protein